MLQNRKWVTTGNFLKITIESEFEFIYNLIKEDKLSWKYNALGICFPSMKHVSFLLSKFMEEDEDFHIPPDRFPSINNKLLFPTVNHVLQQLNLDPNLIIDKFANLTIFKLFYNKHPFKITAKREIFELLSGNYLMKDAIIINNLYIINKDEAILLFNSKYCGHLDFNLNYIKKHWYLLS